MRDGDIGGKTARRELRPIIDRVFHAAAHATAGQHSGVAGEDTGHFFGFERLGHHPESWMRGTFSDKFSSPFFPASKNRVILTSFRQWIRCQAWQ
ncbi:hypothetical protein [Rhizobium herbae]|uniref:Uncharacterized protein n=1 Tax=Rhizobium herbae TaxID=508661 RepID=A0ABS4EKQ9_9HYPH|nr:hypothetical protein [Rhizobium herbae]MBP1858515.1 hypothetical protein [Rhizobium herbae]